MSWPEAFACCSLAPSPAASRRLGVVSTDPLRIIGLRAIFDSDGARAFPAGAGSPAEPFETASTPQIATEVIPLSAPSALTTDGLSIVMIDSGVTPYLLELLAAFRRARPDLRLVVLGDKHDPEYIQQIIGAGAKGYLTHTATEAEVRMALSIVEDGSVWAPRKVMARLLESARSKPSDTPRAVPLTPRELEVMLLLVEGCSNREIAARLGIDDSTVKAHIGRLMRKAGVTNRTALTVHALSRQSIGGTPY